MSFRRLRRKALDLNVNLRDAYVAAGIDRLVYWKHSRRSGEPTPAQEAAIDEMVTFLAAGRCDPRRTIWSQRVCPAMVRLRHLRGLSTGETEDRIGVTVNMVAKWECEMRHPNGYMMSCWAEALDAEFRPIPREILSKVDALVEKFYARKTETA